MAEQGSVKIGDRIRGKHTQDNRFFTVTRTTLWPRTGERVLHGRTGIWSDDPEDHSEFESNVEQLTA